MIRSSIGIVCVLVFITTCAQSTAAQACGDYSLSALRGRALQSQLNRWIELADQGVSDRILSTDAYHDEYRFRAAPVKQSRNWKMPLVHVLPAKDISTTFNQPLKSGTPVTETQTSPGTSDAPVFNWVWESSSDLAVRYCELDDPLDQVPFDFIPRTLPPQVNHSTVKCLELKLAKVTPAKEETVQHQPLKSEPPITKTQASSGTNSAPVFNWVWESSSDLAVRFCELDDPLDQVPFDFIPRPLPSKVKRLELKLAKVAPAKVAPAKEETVQQKRPAKDTSTTFSLPPKSGQTVTEASPTRGTSGDPVFNWVWESSSDLAVRYCELDEPLDQVPFDFIPRTLPPQVKRLELKLAKVTPPKEKTVQRKRAMTTNRKDYWNYYGDCDRWNVVFAVPTTPSPSNLKDSQQVVEAQDNDQRKSEIALGLQELAALVAQRWENATCFCLRISNRFLTSGS